jgi:cytochrome c biogenesis protein CcdA
MPWPKPEALVLALFIILVLAPLREIRGVGEEGKVCVLFFYSPTCAQCHGADEILKGLGSRLPNLDVHRLNILVPDNMRLMQELEEAYNAPLDKRGLIPAIYVGGHFLIGQRDIEGQVADVLANVKVAPCPPQVLELEGGLNSALRGLESLTVPAVAGAAFIDSLNPCSFSALILLLSLLAVTGRRRDLIVVGLLFVLGVFTAYTLLGFSLLTAVQAIESFSEAARGMIYPLTSVATFALGILSIVDYVSMRKGKEFTHIILRLPHRIREGVEDALRFLPGHRYISLMAPLIGFGVSFLEFMCTGQIYLPTIVYIAGFPSLRVRAASYLLLYNAIYVAPLVIIIAASYIAASLSYHGLMRRLLSRIGALKMLTAIFFFVLSLSSALLSLQFPVKVVQGRGPEVGIAGFTDRSVYRITDVINASIVVNSSIPIQGAEIVVQGLKNDNGIYLVSYVQSVNLTSGINKFNAPLRMPFCLQCVNLSPGENEIVFEVRSDNMTLAKMRIGIDIAP